MVTGASAGIGAAVALGLAGAGHAVALGARRTDRLEEVAGQARALGARVWAGSLDVSDPASVERFFAGCEKSLGVADVVINNAGGSRPSLLHEYPLDGLQSEVATNFLGPILVTRRALQPLREQGAPGDVIFVTSDAVRHPRPQQLLYGASKAGIENLASGLALELEGTGIRVTKLRLGPTFSEFGAAWDPAAMPALGDYWRHFGLRDGRLKGVMLPAEAISRAILHVIESPPDVWVDTLEVQPGSPAEPDAG